MKAVEYSNHLVCFLDVLGFKNLIHESTYNKVAMNKVKLVANLFSNIQKSYLNPHWNSNFNMPFTKQGFTKYSIISEETIEVNMSLFSDSIIISYKLEKEERFITWYRQIYQIFNDICRLQYEFALNGIFIRGGLSYGELFHEGDICIGPALIQAVELEKSAINPCISIDPAFMNEVINDMKSDEIDDYAPGYKMPHSKKQFAIDLFAEYINRIDAYGCNTISDKYMLDWLLSRFCLSVNNIKRIKPIIEDELEKEYPKHIKEKYKWLKDYYNQTIMFEQGHANMKI